MLDTHEAVTAPSKRAQGSKAPESQSMKTTSLLGIEHTGKAGDRELSEAGPEDESQPALDAAARQEDHPALL